MIQFIKIVALVLCLISASHADSIYKTVDENGRVTYSSTPPENSKDISEINIAAPPSEKQIKAAQERHEGNLKAAEILDENRNKRNEQIAEENRIKREKQKTQPEESYNNEDYGYPYYRRRNPNIIRRPVTRPSGPAR